jgi:excisionase family DNA binding protein
MSCCVCVVYGYLPLVSRIHTVEVSGTDRDQLATAFADADSSGPVQVHTETVLIELPQAAADAVRHLLVELASGAAVYLLAEDAEMTTQEAADLLGISRTYLVRLVDLGKLPAHLVGTHRRLRAADVLAYQARRNARLKAASEITESDAAAGVPYR